MIPAGGAPIAGPRRPGGRPRRLGRPSPSPPSPLPPPPPSPHQSSSSPVPVVAVRRILSKPSATPPDPAAAKLPPTAVLGRRRVFQAKAQQQPPPPRGPLPIIDQQLRFNRNAEGATSSDPTCTMAVGVLGPESTGKSLLISALASALFATQTEQSVANQVPGTAGVEAIFAPDTIYIDSPPLNAISSLMAWTNAPTTLPPPYKGSGQAVVGQSVEIALFLLSACNLVLLVQDSFAGDAALQTVATAAMLLRASSSGPGGARARVAFVYTKVADDLFTNEQWRRAQAHLRAALDADAFPSRPNPLSNDLLGVERRDALDLFLIPTRSSGAAYQITIDELAAKIGALRAGAPFSHSAWVRNSGRTWDEIRASKVVGAWNRVLAQAAIP